MNTKQIFFSYVNQNNRTFCLNWDNWISLKKALEYEMKSEVERIFNWYYRRSGEGVIIFITVVRKLRVVHKPINYLIFFSLIKGICYWMCGSIFFKILLFRETK